MDTKELGFKHRPLKSYGKIVGTIGSGGYSEIFVTTKNFVIKEMMFEHEQLDSVILREIAYTTALDHPHIIKYHDIFMQDDRVLVVMDRYQGDLVTLDLSYPFSHHRCYNTDDEEGKNTFLLSPEAPPSDPNKLLLACQLIHTVAYITSRNIVHHDIKPQNIFYQMLPDGKIKGVIADFGSASSRECLGRSTHDYRGTPNYKPPETFIFLRHGEDKMYGYDSRADVWALGCVIYYIFTGQALFNDGDDTLPALIEIMVKIGGYDRKSDQYQQFLALFFSKTAEFNDLFFEQIVDLIGPETTPQLTQDPHLNDLLARMLHPNPAKRDSIFELQYHPLFKDCGLEPVPNLSCIDRINLFLDTTSAGPPPEVARLLHWARNDLNLSAPVTEGAIQLFNRIKDHLEDPSRGFLTLIYILAIFWDDVNIIDDILADHRYTFDQIKITAQFILEKLDYKLYVTTPNDLIATYNSFWKK
jgi:serine/threonine protein kinase